MRREEGEWAGRNVLNTQKLKQWEIFAHISYKGHSEKQTDHSNSNTKKKLKLER